MAPLSCPPFIPYWQQTETTWLPISDGTDGTLQQLPPPLPLHSLFHVPAPALLSPGWESHTALAWEISVPRAVRHREVEPPCNLGLCWLQNTRQTSDCALLCTHLNTRRQRWSKRYRCLNDCRAFGTNAGVPGRRSRGLGSTADGQPRQICYNESKH